MEIVYKIISLFLLFISAIFVGSNRFIEGIYFANIAIYILIYNSYSNKHNHDIR